MHCSKLTTLLFFLLTFPSVTFAACTITFSLGDQAAVGEGAYRAFIDDQVRPLIKEPGGDQYIDLNVATDCGAGLARAQLSMLKSNYYILSINGKELTEAQYKYKTSDVIVNKESLADAVIKSKNILSAADSEINNWVKIYAYFFAESARFAQVETEAEEMLGRNECGINWIESVTLLRHWGATSRFAFATHQTDGMIFNAGGTLGSPVPTAVVESFNHAALSGGSDPNYQFIKESDRGHPIEVGATKCDIPLRPKNFLQMVLYRLNVSIPSAADDGM